MQPEVPALPKLHFERHYAIATPIGWARHLACAELFRETRYLLFERGATLQWPRLGGGAGADAAFAVPGREVSVGLRSGRGLDQASDANLPPQALPIEEQSGLRISGKLHTLGAVAIRVEDEAALIGALEENHSHVGQPIGIHRRHGHGLWICRLGRLGFSEPLLEERKRLL